ncbi:MAG: hypothetical protein ACRELA_23515 [Candidatus Rokuibacteriota bacterium]
MSQRRHLILGILGASLGALLVFTGLAVLLGQVATYVDTLRWPGYSLLELTKSPIIKSSLPGALQSWLHRPDSPDGLHAAVVGFLEVAPAFVVLIGLGGVMLRKALS